MHGGGTGRHGVGAAVGDGSNAVSPAGMVRVVHGTGIYSTCGVLNSIGLHSIQLNGC